MCRISPAPATTQPFVPDRPRSRGWHLGVCLILLQRQEQTSVSGETTLPWAFVRPAGVRTKSVTPIFAPSMYARHFLTTPITVHTIIPMEIAFDPAKDAANIANHGLSLATANELEWEWLLAKEDSREEYGEQRISVDA